MGRAGKWLKTRGAGLSLHHLGVCRSINEALFLDILNWRSKLRHADEEVKEAIVYSGLERGREIYDL